VNQARNDGLQLAHWHQRQDPLVPAIPNANTQDGQQSTDSASEPIATAAPVEEGEYKFAKYNLQIQAPIYSPELYDQHLQNEEWSKEETEYLLDLHKDFYGKWPLITDRYDFKPTTAHDVQLGTDPATQAAPAHRTMEDLKHRFYTVSAALMSAQTPLANMSTAEFELHEKLQKFNPKQEIDRKRYKELIMARSEEDKKEEDHLLAELRRIYFRQKRNEEERAELRDRLDHSITDALPDAPPFKTSAEINVLFQKMSNRDKIQKQRRSIIDAGSMQSPANVNGTPNAGGASKRGSIAIGAGPNTPGAGRRQLSAQEDIRYGVSHHDRLTSGVTFRSDRILKVRQAKSQVQTQKIAAILTELQVPDLFQMPTDAVVGGMEKLVQKVGMLIEARKVKEKEENDLKVAIERKKLRDAAGGGSPIATADNGDGADTTMADGDGEQEATELNDATVVDEEENEEDGENAEEEEGEDQEGDEIEE
jgi:DNA methyltransferase 1-associated protein 1